MIRLAALCIAGACLSGCLNWQGSYDNAARRQCETVINAEQRQACLTNVERNASEHRREQRS